MGSIEQPGPWALADTDEVHLSQAPLERVLCQVRFPRLTRLAADPDATVVNALALELVEDYPEFDETREVQVQIAAGGVTQTFGPNLVWTLKSADGTWEVFLGAEFLSLQCVNYTDRADFRDRFLRVVEALSRHVSIPRCERIGFRYSNRVSLSTMPLQDLRGLVRQEMLGGLGVQLNGQEVTTSMSEAIFNMAPNTESSTSIARELPDCVQVRWGLLPANGQLDISLPPSPEASWVLDIDSYRNYGGSEAQALPFDEQNIGDEVSALSLRAYQFFRWAVNGEFLEAFGAER